MSSSGSVAKRSRGNPDRRRRYPRFLALAGFLLLTHLGSAPRAVAAEIAAGVSVSTLGWGVELSATLGSRFGLRLGAHQGSVDRDFTEDGVDYEGDLELENASLLLDWHPTGGAFRFSGGAIVNHNEIVARASADDLLLEIGNVVIPASQVASLRGTASFDSLSPYLGIGASTRFGRERGWGFLFDLGVVFQGSPEVDLEGSLIPELAALEPLFQAELRIEEENLEREIDEYDLYPVISLGVSYSF
jgi:hypothetical protein